MAATFHPLEEFGDFPWDKLDTSVKHEFYQGDFVICVESEYWEIPDNLGMLLDFHIDHGEEKAKQAMCEALGAKKEDFDSNAQ